MVDRLLPVAEQLHCVRELEACRRLPSESGAEQQIALYDETLSRRKVVERMISDNAWQDSPEEEPSTI